MATLNESAFRTKYEDLISEELINRLEKLPYMFQKGLDSVFEQAKKTGKDVLKAMEEAGKRYYNEMSAAEKFAYDKEIELAEYRKKTEEKIAAISAATNDDQKKLLEEEFKSIKKAHKEKLAQQNILQAALEGKQLKADRERRKQDLQDRIEAIQELAILQGKLEKDQVKEIAKLKLKLDIENAKKSTSEYAKAAAEHGLSQLMSFTGRAIDEAESIATSYAGTISSRLLGTGKNWTSISRLVTNNLAASPLVSMQKVLDNVNLAVTSGIAYNVEQRAFLATVKDEIVNTFDAFDSNLLRLIRILSADSTAARLGLEAALSKSFNAWFEDTAYLNDAFDTVSANLLEASSLLSRAASTELEYAAQKWLGALYEAGASQNLIGLLSLGIGWLGSGNVSALTGNEQLNALFAMSALRANLNYALLLTEGINSSLINTLMSAMVDYLQEIASDTKQNNILRSAYGNVFNMSVSDILAVTNLNSEILTNLLESTYSYDNLVNVTEERLNTLSDVLPLSYQLATFMNNLKLGTGLNLMNYAGGAGYIGYKALDTIQQYTGGIPIPVPLLGPIGTVEGLGKAAIAGLGLLGTLIGSVASEGGASTLSGWGAEDIKVLGGGGLDLTTTRGKSSHTLKGSSKDIEGATVESGIEESESIRDEYATDEDAITMEDLFYGFFSNKDRAGILSQLQEILVSNNNALPVKIVSAEGLILPVKNDSTDKLLTDIKNGLGYGTFNEESIKNMLTKVSDSAGVSADGLGIINVNLASSDVGLAEMSRIGSRADGGVTIR